MSSQALRKSWISCQKPGIWMVASQVFFLCSFMEMTLLGWQIKCMANLPLQVGRATCLESTPVPFLPGRNLQGHVNRNHVWPQIQETHPIAIIKANNSDQHILIISHPGEFAVFYSGAVGQHGL